MLVLAGSIGTMQLYNVIGQKHVDIVLLHFADMPKQNVTNTLSIVRIHFIS